MAMTAQHRSQAQSLGLSDAQISQIEAAGLDWTKVFAFIQQILPLILQLFVNPTPTPAPAPPGPTPAQR
jgi:hypothetical protein